MAVTTQTAAEFGSEVEQWVLDAEAAASEHVSSRRVESLAHAALVSASLKARTIQLTAESMLAQAQVEANAILTAAQLASETRLAHADTAVAKADSVLMEALADAEQIREDVLNTAQRDAAEITETAQRAAAVITDRAFDQRDLLLSATLERIAGLSTELIGMADQIISHAEDPVVARTHLAHFMLTLTDMAEQIESEAPQS